MFQRGRTCLDHSILDQSSVPRNINEYIVNSHILSTSEDLITRFDFANGDSITSDNNIDHPDFNVKIPKASIDIQYPAKQELDAKMKEMLKETIKNDITGILCNVTSNRESSMKVTTKRYLHYCNNSSYHPNVLRTDNHDLYSTISINGTTIAETSVSTLVKCNKSEIHNKPVLKRGRCVYAIRIGNALKVCKRIRCRNGKKSKNLRHSDINMHGETVSPWLVQHFVDAL